MNPQIQTEPAVPLRDLDDEQFAALYGTDRFTATVLANRLRYVTEHMSTGLLQRSFSPIISAAYDFATAICGPPEAGYPMAAVGNGLLIFLGTVPEGVRNAVEEFGPERLQDGDMLICNDPYRIGNHVNDVMFIQPFFAGGVLSGFVVIRAHQLDMGGIVPAGFGGNKRNVQENGLVLGPRLLYQAGEPVKETFALILDNARFGPVLLPDLKTTYQSLRLGSELLAESIERYGREAWEGTLRYCCDSSAETLATALERLPDGDYEGAAAVDGDFAGEDEVFEVRVRIVKRGRDVEADLSRCSRQARTCINAGPLDVKTTIGVVLKMLIDPDTPFTSGTFRPIDCVIPPGSVVFALPPDGAIFFYWEVTSALLTALLEALAPAVGPDAIAGDCGSSFVHNASGVLPDGTPWTSVAEGGGEYGARGATKAGDGDSFRALYMLNLMSTPTEVVEHNAPAMILRKEYEPDTHGVGFNRGGSGYIKDTLWLEAGEHYSVPMRFRQPSGVGVYGGGDGIAGGIWWFSDQHARREGQLPLDDSVYAEATPIAGNVDPQTNAPKADGEYAYFGREQVWRTEPMALWRYRVNGGGGWGQALERDPERVKRDVRDGYVTIEGALRDYGVVVTGDPERHPEQLQVDAEATRKARAERS